MAAGQKLKLTRFKAQQIVDAVSQGASLLAAAGAIGIGRSTLFRWLQDGEELKERLEAEVEESIEIDRAVWEAENRGDEKPIDTLAHIRRKGEKEKDWIKVELWDAVKRAQAKAQLLMVQRLVDHSKVDWRAAAWYLERTDRETYGRQDTVKVTGANGGPVEVGVVVASVEAKLAELTDEQLEGALQLVECIVGPERIATAGSEANLIEHRTREG